MRFFYNKFNEIFILLESLLLLDNLNGIEFVECQSSGHKRSTFLATQHIVINEAITMVIQINCRLIK